MREFYYNIQFKDDGSILTRVNNIAICLDEGVLSKILRVPREGTGSVLGRTCSSEFAAVISKTPTTKVAGIYKKIMKISISWFLSSSTKFSFHTQIRGQ